MEEEKKVYIGNLEFGVTDESLRKFFEEKGVNAKEVKIITDKFTGRSKGFGFAEFDSEDLAEKAIEALNGQQLNGRTLKVNKAQKMRPRGERDSFSSRGGSGGGGSRFGGRSQR